MQPLAGLRTWLLGALVIAGLAGAWFLVDRAGPPAQHVFVAGQFGTVHLYRPSGPVRQVVIFFSGDGGWHGGVLDMAEQLRQRGALVAGIDVSDYFRGIGASHGKCAYLGADVERLSRLVQQHAGVENYHYPILVGYSAGASLVYALLNQTPPGVFAGGLSLAFCPELDLAKPLCRGEQLAVRTRRPGISVDLLPVARISDPWVALHGEDDDVCPAEDARRLASGIDGGRFVLLPSVGHRYAGAPGWAPQFLAAYDSLSRAPQAAPPPPPAALADLPMIEKGMSAAPGDRFVVLLTGDGGYAGMDQRIVSGFNARGEPVAALNSLKYFWKARTPGELAGDVDRIIRHYAAAWHRQRVVLVGYSQGADVLPFVLNRLSPESRARIVTAAAVGLSASATFEFHITSWLMNRPGVPVGPELKRLDGLSWSCIYGADEHDSPCLTQDPATTRIVRLPGGHHFNGDYMAVARAVLDGTARQ